MVGPAAASGHAGSLVHDDTDPALRKAHGSNVLLMTDECFCEYTDHGHCGILCDRGGILDVDNDATLPILAQQCVSHARAGAEPAT